MTAEEINDLSIEYRGFILNELTKLERCFDVFLAQYFTTDEEKVDELILMVFGTKKITFDNKKGLLAYLVKKNKVTIHNNYPDIISHLDDLNALRNILAHYMIDDSLDAQKLDEGTIRFYKLEHKQSFEVITKEQIKICDKQFGDIIALFLLNTNSKPPVV